MKKNNLFFLSLVMALSLGAYGCGDEAADAVKDAAKSAAKEAVSQIREMVSENETPQIESVSEDKYAYGTLDEETRRVYDEIVYTIQNREKNLRISTKDVRVMEQAYQAVRSDYCGFFWLDKFSYVTYRRGKKITGIDLTPSYSMTEKEQAAVQKKIDGEADRMLAAIPAGATEYDQALTVYETLIREVDYVEDSADNQNIISVFLNHATICQGYAYATQYLLEKLGIPCATVSGTARGENHAWNLVFLDGDYYYIDTTWGNSQYIYRGDSRKGSDGDGGKKFIDYDYFAVTSEEIQQTHQPDGQIRLPDCTATADNYYVREGRYFSTWDAEAVGDLIRGEYERGADQIQIKFSDMELYEQAIQYFVEDFHVADYCPGLESVRYLENPDNSVLFLVFPPRTGY